MDEQQQYSTCSCPERHPAILKLYHLLAPARILSVGCSVGHELLSLHKYFPNATIVGSELNADARASAKQATVDIDAITVFDPSCELDAIERAGPYDLITCFNVACIFPSPSLRYPYDKFQGLVESFVKVLAPNGEIACFGTNYSIKELIDTHPEWDCVAEPTRIKQSQIPMYTAEGLLIPPDQARFFRVRKGLARPTPLLVAPLKAAPEERAVQVGVLGYSRSTNVGDYMQTLAQINILSFFYNHKWTFESAALEQTFQYFASLKYGAERTGSCKQNAFNRVHVRWIDRDSIDECETSEPIWVIMNGWYAHRKANGCFAWPPAGGIRPLFISFHCQDSQFLNDACITYLKRHEPIGCRDFNTADLLRARGIQSWFSGCLTSTLDSDGRASSRTKHTFTIDCKPTGLDGELTVGHLQRDIKEVSFDYALAKTLNYFREYTHSSGIKTSRLHAFIPCIACGTPAEFVSPHGGLTPEWLHRSRFEGLIQRCLDDTERELGALLITNRLVDSLMCALVDRLPAEDVYRVFQKISTDRFFPVEKHREEYLLENSIMPEMIRLSFPAIVGGAIADRIADSECWKLSQSLKVVRKSVLKPFIRHANVLITVDRNYITIAPVMLSSLSVNNPHILWRVHCIQRNLMEEDVLQIRRACARFPNIVLFVHTPRESFDKYHTHLSHVSESCLDRLFIETLDYGDSHSRVIYMDLDMLVLGELDPLLELNTGRKGICARSSLKDGTVSEWVKKLEQADIVYNYAKSFNAGLFVADLDVLRANDFTPFVLERARDTGVNDQIILNLYAAAQYAELPDCFNVFVGQDKVKIGTSKILHFAGSKKPWLNLNEPSLNALWDYYASGAYTGVRDVVRG